MVPLANEYAKIRDIFASEDGQKDMSTLAEEVKPAIRGVYQRRGVSGMREFNLLTPEEIVKDAKDFPKTVFRELIGREYLRRVAKEQQIAQEIRTQCKPDLEKYNERIDRHRIIIRILDEKKAKRHTRREMKRVNRDLNITDEERKALNVAYRTQQGTLMYENIIDPTQFISDVEARKQFLKNEEKKRLDLGEKGEETVPVFDEEMLDEADGLFQEAAFSQLDLSGQRNQLMEYALQLKIGATVEGINIVQKKEGEVRSAMRKLHEFEEKAKHDPKTRTLLRKILHRSGIVGGEAYLRARIINQRIQNYALRNIWKYNDSLRGRISAANLDRVRSRSRRTKQHITTFQETKRKPQVVPEASSEKPAGSKEAIS